MTEKHIKHNGAIAEQGGGADMLAGVVARVLYLAAPRLLIPIEVVPPGVGKTIYREPERIDTRGRGRPDIARKQPRPGRGNSFR